MSFAERALATCLLLEGAALTILSQMTQTSLPLGQRAEPVILMTIGLFLFLLGIRASGNPSISGSFEMKLSRPAQWLDVQTWQVVALGVSPLYSILAHYAAGDIAMFNPFAAWAAWLIGIGSCLAGGWNYGGFDLRSNWRPFAYALGFVLLAFPLRAIATTTIPILLNGDEASAGIQGVAFLEGSMNNPFASGWYDFPGLYFLIPAASISLLGHTTAALRIPSALAGALTVGGTYLAGRTMFDHRTGLVAGIALAGFHFHIHFSRIGLNNIWDGLFFVTTVSAAYYGWVKTSRNAFLLAGIGMGLSQYFYPSSRVLLAVVYGFILVSGMFDRERLKRSTANIFAMTVMMLVVLLPLMWYYIENPERYLKPLQRVSILGPWLDNEVAISGLPAWRILLSQLSLGVQSFTSLPLRYWYRPGVPFLRSGFAAVFLLGLIPLILRPKHTRSITLFLWLFMFVLIGAFSESTPAAQRYVAAAPACMLILAHGLVEIGSSLERLWPAATRWMTAAMLGTVMLLAAADMDFYFNKYTPHTRIEWSHDAGVIAQFLANDLVKELPGTQAFFFSTPDWGYYSIPSIPYLAPQVKGFDVRQPWGSPDNPIPASDHLIFIFLPENNGDLTAIRSAYPGGILHEREGFDGQTLYSIYKYETGK